MLDDTKNDDKDDSSDEEMETSEDEESEPTKRTYVPPKSIPVLTDPKTGQPLRDQTKPLEDTGYLGNHVMQDKTEQLLPDKPEEKDFEE